MTEQALPHPQALAAWWSNQSSSTFKFAVKTFELVNSRYATTCIKYQIVERYGTPTHTMIQN